MRPARIFTVGNEGTIKLNTGKPTWCLEIEALDGRLHVEDIDPSSVVMQSLGTGSISEIHAATGKTSLAGDADKNLQPDIQICFRKEDLRQLFSLVTGLRTVTVYVHGSAVTGVLFEGYLTVNVLAGGGNKVASITSDPSAQGSMGAAPGWIRARVFDIRGRLVRTLDPIHESSARPGPLGFDGRDESGVRLPSGIYLMRIDTQNGPITMKTAILR